MIERIIYEKVRQGIIKYRTKRNILTNDPDIFAEAAIITDALMNLNFRDIDKWLENKFDEPR